MSDFLLSTRPRPPGDLRRHLERYLAPVAARCEEHHGAWGSLAVLHGHHDGEAAMDDGRFLSVLVGDPLFRGTPGGPAGIATDGSLRGAVHRLLAANPSPPWDEQLDGAFAALAVDRETGVGRLLTDLLAFVPVFSAELRDARGASLVVGTHPDAVAWASGRNRAVDPVSAADLVTTWCVAFPHTMFAGVEQVAPGLERAFGPEGWRGPGRSYWAPVERNPFRSVAEAAEVLRAGVAQDVRAACDGRPEVGLLLSGGEDSRAVLGAVPAGSRVRGFVFADWENREVDVAGRVARAHGAELVFGRRAPDHYLEHFPAVACLVGSQQLFMDVHGYGFHTSLGIRDLPVVLGGFSADSLLKGGYAGRGAGQMRIRLRPGIRAELLAEVERRHEAHRRRVAALRPESADEWYRLWPFSMRKHAANLHGNRRLFATHEAFHCNASVRVAAAAPLHWKRRRTLFLRAMRPFLRRTWNVPHTEPRYPYFGVIGNALLVPGLAAVRGVRVLATGGVRARQRGFPNWGRVAGSEAAARRFGENPVLGSPLRELFDVGSEAELSGVLRDGWHPLQRMAVLQLAYLLDRAQGG